MARRNNDHPESTNCSSFVLLCLALISCAVVYAFLSVVLRPSDLYTTLELGQVDGGLDRDFGDENGGECCRGIENLELWGAAVKWGSEFKFNSSEQCCKACKAMCTGNDGPCLCDTWVFCGNRDTCGSKFGECWLKKQKNTLAPDRQEAGEKVSWTSGLIFGKGEGIIGLETEYGTLHIKLLPDCAPHSVAYILELLKLRHCAGCEFYRAESRGELWDAEGNHMEKAPYGPPFALIQGTLEAMGTPFKKIPTEACPTIRRGSVAWIGSGPEFFISLANHQEWNKAYTVFGSVLPEDMEIAENIAQLPTKSDVWNNINVSVLEQPVPLLLRRIGTSHGDLVTNVKTDVKTD
ncbi:Cyclophilin-type peptidyl-prolyl cis-trans isomerase domain containing protein [Parasponia andersonii]|uniref:Cyclophilin-type peptidyl-prolyl cis-trans isomerase domain containing protein n=1 Tax=Parasponia andersonii TaxID=3476 RepID=A0A2P5AKG2_PARAD|nr:Cyclophilin-type peptidyl-prolyl cis-trans isomerase domain containing protein [Parasponia andersonii]